MILHLNFCCIHGYVTEKRHKIYVTLKISQLLKSYALHTDPYVTIAAGFICLRVGYREVFWEEFSRLI